MKSKLPVTNCTIRILRQRGSTQDFFMVVREWEALLEGLSNGPPLMEPWSPQEDEDGYSSPFANYNIVTDAKMYNGQSYTPRPGDKILVRESGSMNGEYRQVAEGTKNGAKSVGIFFVELPCIKRKNYLDG